jgi:hypothetical protein
MITGQRGQLAFAVCIGSLLSVPMRSIAGDLAGCYELHLSEWSPSIALDGDKKFIVPPSRIALTTVPDHVWDAHGLRVVPAAGASRSIHPFSYWTRDGRHVHIKWTTGHAGLEMDLEEHDASLIGTAHTFWDFLRPQQTTHVVATKIPCEVSK